MILSALLLPLLGSNAFAQIQSLPAPAAPAAAVAVPALEAPGLGSLPTAMDYLEAPSRSMELPAPPEAALVESSGQEAPANPFLKLRDFRKLDDAERKTFESGVERAFTRAMDPSAPLAERREAVVFLGQAGILSLHDLASQRIVLDKLNRVRRTLGDIRADGEAATQAVYDHMASPLSDPEARDYVRRALERGFEKF